MFADDLSILEEANRRWGAREDERAKVEKQIQGILGTRFDKQLAFIKDPARKKAAFCSRRAGKTEADAAYLVSSCLGGPDRLCIFVAKTWRRAMDLTWKAVDKLCAKFEVSSKPHESVGTRSFLNGSMIRWVGADNIEALSTKRGDKVFLVIIDEAQDFPFSILKQLVDDIFGPSLEDLGGTMCLTGTPGIVCAGYWYEITRPEKGKRRKGWAVFEWNVLNNPHVPLIHQRINSGAIRDEAGGEESPTYQREWLGRWVNDTGALFYRFDTTRNAYQRGDVVPYGPGWMHVKGWDLGKTDAMALVYWGFHPNHRELFEAYSWAKSGVTSDEVVAHAKLIEEQLGLNVVGTAADTGGLGALVVEEVGKRTGMHFEAAQKTQKAAHVRLMNEDFIAGKIKLLDASPYYDEITVLPKLADWDEATAGKPAPEDPRFANHCCDAGLYAWRKALHYLHEKKQDRPAPGTPEAYALEEREMEEAREQQHHERKSRDWWEQ